MSSKLYKTDGEAELREARQSVRRAAAQILGF